MKSTLSQRLRQLTVGWNARNVPASVTKPSFYLLPNFFQTADILWSQFEKQVLDSVEFNDGLTPLLYAFCEGTYQFLTASGERIFSRDALDQVTNALRTWAKEELDASYVSTPQVRVYVDGCRRELLSDSIDTRWHYLLSLTRNGSKDASPIKLVAESVRARQGDGAFSVNSVVSLQLQFNQVLVHDARSPYAIGPTKTAINPLKGSVFLDGYLW